MKKAKKILSLLLAAATACTMPLLFNLGVSAAQTVPGLFVSEVCFNPNYETGSTKVTSNNDYFEFVEIKNVTERAIDLTNADLYYCKEGMSGSTWYKDSFVYESGNDKIINSGETWVVGVYTISTPVIGLGYSNASELSAYWNAFNNYYGVKTSASNRVLSVAAESKKEAWLKGGTSLPNDGSKGALAIVADSVTLGQLEYAPSTYSQDGYAIQTVYDGNGATIKGIAGCTPGTVLNYQMPGRGSTENGTAVNLVSLNVCYDINGVTPATGSASNYSVDKRLPRVISYLNSSNADIICLSEISASWWGTIYANLTSKYDISGTNSCYGLTNGAAHEKETDSYNPIYFNKSKYEKLDEGHFWLLDDSPSIANKICNWVLLKSKNDSTEFIIFNTHLSANNTSTTFESRWSEESKLAKKVNSTVNSVYNSHKSEVNSMPYLICGDFNMNEYSELYRKVLNDCKVKDTKYISGSTTLTSTFNNWGNYTETNGTVIDFCFASDGVNSQKYSVKHIKGNDGYLASDHAAINADLRITSNVKNNGPIIPNFDFSSIIQFIMNIIQAIGSVIMTIASMF